MLIFRSMLLTFFFLLLWQLIVSGFALPSYLLPSPWQVARSLFNHAPLLIEHSLSTLAEIVIGLIGGISLGFIVALLMMTIPVVRQGLMPIIIISQAIPTFAVAPLLVLWFGYGMMSKIIAVTLMLFFPVASSFYEGLVRTNDDWLDMAKIMGSDRGAVLWYLRLPAALPYLAAGIKVAVVLAPIGAIVSEWIGASKGLGFLMLNANARLEIDLMFASLVVMMVISLTLYALIHLIFRKFMWVSGRFGVSS